MRKNSFIETFNNKIESIFVRCKKYVEHESSMRDISLISTLNRPISVTNSSCSQCNIEKIIGFNDNSSKWVSAVYLKDQYFIINFGYNTIKVEKYALRTVTDDYYPIEWEIYGSLDGQKWTIIDHKEDDICEGNTYYRSSNLIACSINAVKIYEVNKKMLLRYLKVKQIGKNIVRKYNPDHTDGFNYAFYLSGFEAYGKVEIYKKIQITQQCITRHTHCFMIFILSW